MGCCNKRWSVKNSPGLLSKVISILCLLAASCFGFLLYYQHTENPGSWVSGLLAVFYWGLARVVQVVFTLISISPVCWAQLWSLPVEIVQFYYCNLSLGTNPEPSNSFTLDSCMPPCFSSPMAAFGQAESADWCSPRVFCTWDSFLWCRDIYFVMETPLPLSCFYGNTGWIWESW